MMKRPEDENSPVFFLGVMSFHPLRIFLPDWNHDTHEIIGIVGNAKLIQGVFLVSVSAYLETVFVDEVEHSMVQIIAPAIPAARITNGIKSRRPFITPFGIVKIIAIRPPSGGNRVSPPGRAKSQNQAKGLCKAKRQLTSGGDCCYFVSLWQKQTAVRF